MKNLTLVLVVSLVLFSCSNHRVTVMDLSDGEFITIVDGGSITKLGDTLVIRNFVSPIVNHYKFYGRYVGSIPKNESFKTEYKGKEILNNVIYKKVIRFK